MKSAEEIMEILEAFDLTGSLRDAAELAGCSHHTVARYVAAREARRPVATGPSARAQLIDEFLPKIEEWIERSKGRIRADMAHEKLVGLGLRRVGAHDPPGGRGGEEGLPAGAGAGAPAVGDRAGDVAAVRLRRRPGDRRGEDDAVRGLAGVVAVPGGARVAGQDRPVA